MILPFAAMSTSAVGVSISEGKDALVAQWEKGENYGFDYRAYSPVTDENDTTKYPLVVMLHGKYSGTNEGEQLTSSDFYLRSAVTARISPSVAAAAILPA